ncbi:MAG: hypothetical protein QOJ50_74 [Cryptosporangiaceae bacterium]|nr:hypothetical protein [Cryptosporangiaceae bacterium]
MSGTRRSPADPQDGPLWSVAAAALARWRGGEQAAFDQLVHTVTPVLWQLARAYGLQRHAAEEIVQATWLQFVRHEAGIRDPRATLRWLSMTTRREAWRYANAARRERPAEAADLEAHVPPAPDPAALAQLDRDGRTLWCHVAALSERCRRLLRVVAFEDRPDYSSLAVEFGLRAGSIGPTRRRCLDRLRALLDADPEWSLR